MIDVCNVEAYIEEATDNLKWNGILSQYPMVSCVKDSNFKVLLKFKPGLFEEGYVRNLSDELNKVFANDGVMLSAPSHWNYNSEKVDGTYYCSVYLKEPSIIDIGENDRVVLNSYGLYSNPVVLYIRDNDGSKLVFKKCDVLDSKILSNGYRQMSGHSSEVLYKTDSGIEGVVSTHCIHPALGEDVSFRITKR